MHERQARLLMAPSVLVIGIFMAVPMLIAFAYSVMTADTYGGVTMPLSPDGWLQLIYQRDFDDALIFSPAYAIIILRSVVLATLTAVICLAMGLPVAWFIVCRRPQSRPTWLFLVTLPFWINTLIRTYCWVLILRDEGLLNHFLQGIGLTGGPIQFLYNDLAILLGLVYTFLPFMVLPIYSTLERIDPRVVEAAHDLYADRRQAFRRVVWPLAKSGAVAGSLLVFAPALGTFLAPDLLGGGRNLLIGSLIQMEFSSGRNWPFGAALSTLITAGVLLGLWWQARRVRPAVAAL
jgi:spermidine/putrescine transport system permease protein